MHAPPEGGSGLPEHSEEGRNRIARHSHYDLSEDGNFLEGSSFYFDKRTVDPKSDLRPFSSELYHTRALESVTSFMNSPTPDYHVPRTIRKRASLELLSGLTEGQTADRRYSEDRFVGTA